MTEVMLDRVQVGNAERCANDTVDGRLFEPPIPSWLKNELMIPMYKDPNFWQNHHHQGYQRWTDYVCWDVKTNDVSSADPKDVVDILLAEAGFITAYPGDWIVRSEDGKFTVVKNKT